jgi:hypothetical protein
VIPKSPRIIAAKPSAGAMTFLASDRGTPYTPTTSATCAFRPGYRTARRTVSGWQLRADRLNWGASVHEIAAVTGHLHQGADQRRLAASGLARLAREQSTMEKSTFARQFFSGTKPRCELLMTRGLLWL